MSQVIIDLLNAGTQANAADKFRRGNIICLPDSGNVVMTGDIHGHRRNFERILSFADLANNPERHVVLQEIIHGGPEDAHGGCLSYQLLFEAVRYKRNYPDRVHIIMGNHDTTFINNSRVMKDGKEMNGSMRSALRWEFQEAGADVQLAMRQFLFSQPLAVRCKNRIWLSHSLPEDRYFDKFEGEIFNRELKVSDIVRPGPVYIMTWGRRHSQHLLDKMAELLDVDIFIFGHQPQQDGWNKAARNLIIIASDHEHGCLLPLSLSRSYTIEQVIESIVPLASIA